jgi:hypothetical protein
MRIYRCKGDILEEKQIKQFDKMIWFDKNKTKIIASEEAWSTEIVWAEKRKLHTKCSSE